MTTKPLWILGAGKFAIEIADVAEEIGGWTVEGLVQNVSAEDAGEQDGFPVYRAERAFRDVADRWFVCAIGSTKRRSFIEEAVAAGCRFATLVHPWTRISPRAEIGEGTIVGPGAVVAAGSRLGRHVIVNRGTLIGHHSEIGDFATLGPGVNICGSCSLAARTFIGAGALVRDHVAIGAGAVVAMSSVVMKEVEAGVMVGGNPARLVKRGVDGL